MVIANMLRTTKMLTIGFNYSNANQPNMQLALGQYGRLMRSGSNLPEFEYPHLTDCSSEARTLHAHSSLW